MCSGVVLREIGTTHFRYVPQTYHSEPCESTIPLEATCHVFAVTMNLARSFDFRGTQVELTWDSHALLLSVVLARYGWCVDATLVNIAKLSFDHFLCVSFTNTARVFMSAIVEQPCFPSEQDKRLRARGTRNPELQAERVRYPGNSAAPSRSCQLTFVVQDPVQPCLCCGSYDRCWMKR